MATRSVVGYKNSDGTVNASYVHFDGYLDGVGVALQLNHNNDAKAKKLGYAKGIRSIELDKPVSYYNDMSNQTYESEDAFHDAVVKEPSYEYGYLYDDSRGWLFTSEKYGTDEFIELEDQLMFDELLPGSGDAPSLEENNSISELKALSKHVKAPTDQEELEESDETSWKYNNSPAGDTLDLAPRKVGQSVKESTDVEEDFILKVAGEVDGEGMAQIAGALGINTSEIDLNDDMLLDDLYVDIEMAVKNASAKEIIRLASKLKGLNENLLDRIKQIQDFEKTEDDLYYNGYFVQKYVEDGETTYVVFKDRGLDVDPDPAPDFESTNPNSVKAFLLSKTEKMDEVEVGVVDKLQDEEEMGLEEVVRFKDRPYDFQLNSIAQEKYGANFNMLGDTEQDIVRDMVERELDIEDDLDNLDEEVTDKEIKKLKKLSKALKGASKSHAKQAEKLEDILKEDLLPEGIFDTLADKLFKDSPKEDPTPEDVPTEPKLPEWVLIALRNGTHTVFEMDRWIEGLKTNPKLKWANSPSDYMEILGEIPGAMFIGITSSLGKEIFDAQTKDKSKNNLTSLGVSREKQKDILARTLRPVKGKLELPMLDADSLEDLKEGIYDPLRNNTLKEHFNRFLK